MAGGIGSRFWPHSRNSHPKQFLDILGTGQSLLQMTFQRFLNICPQENIFIVTNENYAQLVGEQIPQIDKEQILLEPIRRNTAPCIAYACFKIYKRNPEALVVITPSDHAIFQESKFYQAVAEALEAAAQGDRLLTLGIRPNRPETGYGYIQYLEGFGDDIKKVKTFTEKPQLDLAQKFIESGDFVWNAGIFIWSINAFIQAFDDHLPEISEVFKEGLSLFYTEHERDFIQKAYSQSKNISIDYGVMEKAQNVYVVLGDFGWSDVGSWNSLYELRDKDANQNVIDANALVYESRDNMIKGPQDQLIVVQGLEGYLVADCENVLLICKKEEEARFREFVSDVKEKKGNTFL